MALNLATLLALLGACPSVLAATCAELQRSIEARLHAKGVANFTLTPVDAAASAPGQVVGTCEQGRIKLLYIRGATPSVQSRSSATPVITECADGRILKEGSCKQ